jgi:hypothetical protein
MTKRIERAGIRASVLGALGTLVVSIALLASTGSASAAYKQFCWGVTLPGPGNVCDSLYHDGIAGLVTEVDGSSPDHSVCVLAWWGQGIEMCSAGPNQGVYNTTPPGVYNSVGQIRPNANASTRVYGAVILCATPGC